MKRSLLILTIFGAMTVPVLAQHGRTIYTDEGKIRTGTGCYLFVDGQRRAGSCTVIQNYESPITFIHAGDATYKIVRTRVTKFLGSFYRVTNAGDRLIGEVEAEGKCWIGEEVKFCAE